MQLPAILTKYLEHPPRIEDTANNTIITIKYNARISSEMNHKLAAIELQNKLKWDYYFVTGTLHNGDKVHVQLRHYQPIKDKT